MNHVPIWVDVIRIIMAVVAGFVILFLPRALDVHRRATRTSLLVLGFDLLMISIIGQLVFRLHQHVVFYGLPLVAPGILAIAVYIAQALWAQHQGRYTHREP
jgi:hypothetical protein